MESLNQVDCESGGCFKWETEIEHVEDWHNLKLNVQVKNGSMNALNITAKMGSVVLRGCKEDVDVQFPKNFEEVKEAAGIKFMMHDCNEYLCNSALDIVSGLLTAYLPFCLLVFNLFTIYGHGRGVQV